MLAALKPWLLTCAPIMDAASYMYIQGSRRRICFFTCPLQRFPISTVCGAGNHTATSPSVHGLWLVMLLLASGTSPGRFVLSGIVFRAPVSGTMWAQGGTRTRAGYKTMRLPNGTLPAVLYQLSYLRLTNKLKTNTKHLYISL